MRLTPRRLVLMAVTMLLSAELTAGWVLSRDPVYEGSVTVFLSQLFPRGTAVADIDPFAQTFQLTMKSPERIAEISSATGVPAGEVRGKLGSTRSGQSPIVRVTYGPGDEGVVTDVAQQAAVLSLRALAQAEVDRAETRLDQARSAADDGRRALREFETETGLVDLDQAYEEQRTELVEQLDANEPAAVVEASQEELDRLSAQRLERDELEGRLNGAVSSIASAEDERLGAEARLAAAGSPSLILANSPMQSSRLPLLARGVIGSALVAMAAWFAVFALVDRRHRRQGPPAGRDRVDFDERGAGTTRDRGDRDPYLGDPVPSGVGASRFTSSPLDRPGS